MEVCLALPLPPQPRMTRVRAACRDVEFESDMEEKLEDIGGLPVMTAEMHALQLKRLEGLGEEPGQEELGAMRWPQRSWWADRARIGARKALQLTLVPTLTPAVSAR